MNRKIFTFLAVAFMLSITAYYANARSVAEKSVGALVKTLALDENGVSLGMYHIQVDSICLRNSSNQLQWYPVTYEYDALTGLGGTGSHLYWNPTGGTYGTGAFALSPGTPSLDIEKDTIILAVTEAGEVKMVSAKHLRACLAVDPPATQLANLSDLQATMWCIGVEKREQKGQKPTLHFTNKIFDLDLDYAKEGVTYVSGRDKGWMYTGSYDNDHLQNKLPFYRQAYNAGGLTGEYLVLASKLEDDEELPVEDGVLWRQKVIHGDFLDYGTGDDTVAGMLKVSIMRISPFLLTAEDFNTVLGHQKINKLVELHFAKTTSETNNFAKFLKAYPSENITVPAPYSTMVPAVNNARRLGYLNVEAFDKVGDNYVSRGFIVNSNKSQADDPNKYNNSASIQYLNLSAIPRDADQRKSDTDPDGYNHSYRFIYFPSEDSLVINAYYVKHDNTYHGNIAQIDSGYYKMDGSNPNYYYGFYTPGIHNYLTVRYQDLSKVGNTSMMTVNSHPDNIRIFFDINTCTQILLDAWQPAKGVYTIWDEKGRCLGIRIYNGSITPQWIELDPGECPDRIPSFQWVVERMENGYARSRIMITNREFGDMTSLSSDLVQMQNVLVTRASRQIFRQQTQFLYNPLVPTFDVSGYEPIIYGWVEGKYLTVDPQGECGIGGKPGNSGFRPVNNAYLTDQYLGYKHFEVNKESEHPSFGKSEDTGLGKGMDYNAYSFNYLSYLDENNMYINLGDRYNEKILKAEQYNKTPFQFMLADAFKPHCQEEPFGYPRIDLDDWKKLDIEDTETGYVYPKYTQDSVPLLKRYYYELKVADFYNYRDGLAEQFVVLKGAKADFSDIKNAMLYGVADVYALKHPFKITNIYLRESKFLVKLPVLKNEERHPADPTRRIYYAVLDRIEEEQLHTVSGYLGEISDRLMSADGSSNYNLVAWDVDYQTGFIKARGKVVTATNVAVFALQNYNFELYRRLRSRDHDGAKDAGDGMDVVTGAKLNTNLDAPKTLRIYRDLQPSEFLFEDGMSETAYGTGIKFLGAANSFQFKEEPAEDGTAKYNYHLFIDTAYINRGTGTIKPQYLIAVGQTVYNGEDVWLGEDECENDLGTLKFEPYIRGRYLVNATDSARDVGSDGDKGYGVRDKRYLTGTNWDRLIFVDAIHAHDRLYIMSRIPQDIKNQLIKNVTVQGEQRQYVDVSVLRSAVTSGRLKERLWDDSKKLGDYYDFGRWDNYHNDVCFSLRYRQPNVQNPDDDGQDGLFQGEEGNDMKRFYIESETWGRTPFGNRKIAPVQGGWIFLENHIAALSRGSYHNQIQQGEIFNVKRPTIWQNGEATQNENVVAKVSVVGGVDEVTICNAAGKQVTIVNLLGQTVAKKVMAGNNEPISVPKGIAVVNIEGEKAVKVVVK